MIPIAKTFAAYLEMKKIQGFQLEEVEDPHHSVIFHTTFVLKGQAIPIGIILDDTIYTIIRVNLATNILTDSNAFAVSNLITRLNYKNKLFKYYLTPDTSIILDACIPQRKGHFSPELVYEIAQVTVRELEKNYKEFVSLIWQE